MDGERPDEDQLLRGALAEIAMYRSLIKRHIRGEIGFVGLVQEAALLGLAHDMTFGGQQLDTPRSAKRVQE